MSGSPQATQTPKGSIELSNGLVLAFSGLMAGDLLDSVKQLGCSLEEADKFESTLVLTWRAAVRGGFDGDFKSFADQIPMEQIQEVVLTAAPFLRASVAPK